MLSYVLGGRLGVLGESELSLRCWGGICEVVHRGFCRSTTSGEVVHCRRCHGWLMGHFVHCRLRSCRKCQASIVLLIHARGLCVGRGGFHRRLGQIRLWEFNGFVMVAKTWRSQVIRLVLGLGLGLFRLNMFNMLLNSPNMLLNSLDRLWQLGIHLRRYVGLVGNLRVLTNSLGSSTGSWLCECVLAL